MKTSRPLVSAFPWVGGKWRLFPKLLGLIPDHTRYVSLFGGSAADILRKPRSREEVFNDLDNDVSNFFSVLQDSKRRQRLCARLLFTLYGRKQFSDCLALLRSNESDPVARAWAFYVVACCSHSSQVPSLAIEGNFTVSLRPSQAQRWHQVTATLERLAFRFRHVMIECRPWQQIVKRYDRPKTLFYADPPYVHGSRVSKRLYKYEMLDADHVELVERLRHVKGKVMLSGYANPIYDLLSEWRRLEFDTFCSASSTKKKPRRTEVVWLNYDKHGRTLPFDRRKP